MVAVVGYQGAVGACLEDVGFALVAVTENPVDVDLPGLVRVRVGRGNSQPSHCVTRRSAEAAAAAVVAGRVDGVRFVAMGGFLS